MRQKDPDNLLSALDTVLDGGRSYTEMVEDGQSMERLLSNPDFKRYEALLREAYIKMVDKMRITPADALPVLQGALIQHYNVMALPKKFVKVAVDLVAQHREEAEAR